MDWAPQIKMDYAQNFRKSPIKAKQQISEYFRTVGEI